MLPKIVEKLIIKGGLSHLPPKFEHMIVAVITFPPFLLYKYI